MYDLDSQFLSSNTNINSNIELDDKYLIFRANNQSYAFALQNIKEITKLPKVEAVPDMSENVRGVMKLRESIIPVIDIKIQLGLPSSEDKKFEIMDILKRNKEAHLRWINELESCLVEDREFTLATNPHMCEFGKWYDQYEPENVKIDILFQQFNYPHQSIHAMANTLIKTAKTEGRVRALELFEEGKEKHLNTLLELFDEMFHRIKNQKNEFCIVFEETKTKYSFLVDQIVKIIKIMPSEIGIPDISNPKYTKGVTRYATESIVILDEHSLRTDNLSISQSEDY